MLLLSSAAGTGSAFKRRLLRFVFTFAFLMLSLGIFLHVRRSAYIDAVASDPEASTAMAFWESLMPEFDAYKEREGNFPCFLRELESEVPESILANSSYQATIEGFYIVVVAPQTQQTFSDSPKGVIYYGGSDKVQWSVCDASASCPPGSFARHCYGRPGYPKN